MPDNYYYTIWSHNPDTGLYPLRSSCDVKQIQRWLRQLGDAHWQVSRDLPQFITEETLNQLVEQQECGD